jgi:tetratricopeptide (TPR) repeat protein
VVSGCLLVFLISLGFYITPIMLGGLRDVMLVNVLDAFRQTGINMSFIESRPSKKRNWEYYFFADMKGHESDPALQAAIAALHCQAARAQDTDWSQILRLYDLLLRLQPSPIVSLNRAVALAMVEGPQPALALVDELAAGGELDGYHLLHAARADLLRRMGSSSEAAESYSRALALVTNDSERRFLERRLREAQTPV